MLLIAFPHSFTNVILIQQSVHAALAGNVEQLNLSSKFVRPGYAFILVLNKLIAVTKF